MTKVLGRFNAPVLTPAPSSPAEGELYYDSSTKILYYWNGTAWVSGGSGGGGGSVTLDTWHVVGAAGEPAFQNSWVNFATGYPSASFRKGPDGRVSFRGAIKSGGSGTVAFTLPAGYRPPASAIFMTNTEAAAGVTPGYVNVKADGTVWVAGTTTFLALDVVEFDTDTVGSMSSPVATPLDAWHSVGAAGEPAFQNGFSNHGAAGYSTAGFRKYPDGRVRLRGLIKGGSGGAAIFTLPVGYRPPATVELAGRRYDGTSTGAATFIVSWDGTVLAETGTFTATQLSLDALEFDTESVTAVTSNVAQAMDTWHTVGGAGEPAFQNSWVNYGSGQLSVKFRKFPDGRVRLAGAAKSGSGNGTVAFTLPVGYRPAASVSIPCVAWGGSGYVTINADGTVGLFQISPSVVTSGCWLDGIEFDTEAVNNYVAGTVGGQAVPAIFTKSLVLAGNGGTVVTTPSALPGMALSFTSPPYACWLEIDWHARFNAVAAAWYWVQSSAYLNGVAVTGSFDTLFSVYNGGQNYVTAQSHVGSPLSPSTAYTVQIYGSAQVASPTWDASAGANRLDLKVFQNTAM